jgi:pimeloyl-ACP methyl ester carboxylesterase
MPDLPGFGGRAPFDKQADEVSVGNYAEAIREEIVAWGDEPVALAALSMGGYIAFECWRRFPEKISQLILCDTRAEADSPEARPGRLAGVENARKGVLEPMYAKMATDLVAPPRRDDGAFRSRVLSVMRTSTPGGVEQALFAMMSRPDSRSDLAGITVPTLVVVGAEDGLTPPAAARVMSEGIPDAKLVVIADAGHLAPLERPAAVNTAIRGFLMERVDD